MRRDGGISMLFIGTVISTVLYTVLAFYFTQRYISLRGVSNFYRAFFDITITVGSVFVCCYLFSSRQGLDFTTIYALNYFMFLLILLVFFEKASFQEKLFYCGNVIFLMYAIKGIVYPLCSIITQLPLYYLLGRMDTYFIAIIFSNMLFYVMIAVFTHAVDPEDIREMVQSGNKLKNTVIVQLTFIIALIAASSTYIQSGESFIVPFLHIAAALAMAVGYYVFFFGSIKEIKLEKYKYRSINLKEQLDMQLSHYNAQAGYIDRFRRLKHDYKSQMRGLQFLLQQNKVDAANQYLSDMYDELDRAVGDYKAYSNNNLIDAIMRDASLTCKEISTDFQAMVAFPAKSQFGLNDLELCTLFSNIMRNATESVQKVPDAAKRFITVVSKDRGTWHMVSTRNSYEIPPVMKKGNFVTSKQDASMHGLGIRRIREIVESVGGLVTIKVDEKEKVFNIILQFPKEE